LNTSRSWTLQDNEHFNNTISITPLTSPFPITPPTYLSSPF
jgi:hypothetical protein